jgi:hypothetical protein
MDLGVNPGGSFQVFAPTWGGMCIQSAAAWMCAPHCRSDLARKEFCVGRNLTSRPKSTFLAPTLRAPWTPYRLRTLDTNPTKGFQWRGFPSKIWTNSSSSRSECINQGVAISLFPPLPNWAPPLLLRTPV